MTPSHRMNNPEWNKRPRLCLGENRKRGRMLHNGECNKRPRL